MDVLPIGEPNRQQTSGTILGGDLTAVSFFQSCRHGALQATEYHWLRLTDRRPPASRSYKLAKTIVHGLLVLMICPLGVSAPVDWLTANCTIVSVSFSSGGPKPSSALAA